MTPPTLRLLPFAAADGPTQMAADEVMLEAALAGQSSIRTYVFDPPTLSLGYFQHQEGRLADPELASLAWVRRPTGGGAILHRDDLTYSLALAHAVKGSLTAEAWHGRLHQALAQVLARRGLAAEVLAGRRAPREDLRFLCFAVPQPGDVVLAGRKIAGAAQRLKAGALLQHGSILTSDPAALARGLAEELAAELGWRLVPGDWTAAEIERRDKLVRSKYALPEWNLKR